MLKENEGIMVIFEAR